MSTANQPADLQFERAEFADGQEARAACAFCRRSIEDNYFEVNGQMTCATCREAVAREQATTAGARGVFLAIAAGLGAGLAGALLYYAVLALSGYEFALISIAVGYLVGRAVRWASGGRGGRIYQVVAVVITYIAITGSYAPLLLGELRKQAAAHQTASIDAGQTSDASQASKPETLGSGSSSSPASASPSQTPAAAANPPSLVQFVTAIALLMVVLLGLPFFGGFQNILGIIIIGVALYEAWKLTRRVQITVAGPFALTASATASANPNVAQA